jgi:hypothetical protein
MKLTTTMANNPTATNTINQYHICESNGIRAFSKNEYGADLDTKKTWSVTKNRYVGVKNIRLLRMFKNERVLKGSTSMKMSGSMGEFFVTKTKSN